MTLSIPGWPLVFTLNLDGKCDACGINEFPIGRHKVCHHSTCSACLEEYGHNMKTDRYECSKCVKDSMDEHHKNMMRMMAGYIKMPLRHLGPDVYEYRYAGPIQKDSSTPSSASGGAEGAEEDMKASSKFRQSKKTCGLSNTDGSSKTTTEEGESVESFSEKISVIGATLIDVDEGEPRQYSMIQGPIEDCEVCKTAMCRDCLLMPLDATQ